MLAPVGDLLVQSFALKRVPLPHGEIGVLKGELRQAGCSLFDCGGVELTELPEQDLHRPSVGNDVMDCQRQDVISVRDPKQPGAQRGPLARSKGRFASSIAASTTLANGWGPLEKSSIGSDAVHAAPTA